MYVCNCTNCTEEPYENISISPRFTSLQEASTHGRAMTKMRHMYSSLNIPEFYCLVLYHMVVEYSILIWEEALLTSVELTSK